MDKNKFSNLFLNLPCCKLRIKNAKKVVQLIIYRQECFSGR